MKLPKTYNPQEVEDKIYKLWQRSGFFNPDKLSPRHKKPYCIVIPPPNITGELHMGHALNTVVQDILIRWRRMQGFKTLWVPGTDHAGIATQNAVEKALKKEGKTRFDLGRERFIEKVWEWKTKYGNIILDQLKKMGASCDWSRTRFTMDKNYTLAVQAAFLQYFKKKLKKDAPFRTCFILVWLFSLILVPAKGISAFGIFLAAVGIGTLFVLITIFAIIMISGSENEE